MVEYRRRIVDDLLDEFLPEMTAVALEGAKGVGKTATASRRARTTYSLQRPSQLEVLSAEPEVINEGPFPLFIDEWQLYPPVWDVVRTAVDDDPSGGRFLLAGSADVPAGTRIHSGAGRIDKFIMRPMTLMERGFEEPTISIGKLLRGEPQQIRGSTRRRSVTTSMRSFARGCPASGPEPQSPTPTHPDICGPLGGKGHPGKRGTYQAPETLKAWMTAYGAATSTDASYETILRAATPGQSEKPDKKTVMRYRDLLTRLYILDPVPAWMPSLAPLTTLTRSPKHHMVDPAFPAHLAGVGPEGLLRGERNVLAPDGETWLGALFESLATQSLRVYGEANLAAVRQLRTKGGRQEIDLVLEDWERNTLAVEVKLAAPPATST